MPNDLSAVLRQVVVAALLFWSGTAKASIIDANGDAGVYGVPYIRLGPNAAPIWENYRKEVNTYFPSTSPGVLASSPTPATVQYDGLYQAGGPGGFAYFAPGVFLGTMVSRSSYREADLSLIGVTSQALPQGFDVRIGFMEHQSSTGGAPASAFVDNQGGDNGSQDLYSGNWGVDGLSLHVNFDNTGAQWKVVYHQLMRVAAQSAAQDQSRTDYSAQLTRSGMVDLGGGSFQLVETSDQPLRLHWEITQQGGATYVLFHFGATAVETWLLDDGATHDGLHDPGNPDAVGYEGLSLDIDRLVPAAFLGWSSITSTPPPSASLSMGLAGGSPRLTGLPSDVREERSVSFQVTALDTSDRIDEGYAGTTHFSSSDPTAQLPEDYSFSAADQGAHTFQVTFHTAGLQSVDVVPSGIDVLRSAQSTRVIGKRIPFEVGWGCDSTPETAIWPALLACMAWAAGNLQRKKRLRAVTSTATDRRSSRTGTRSSACPFDRANAPWHRRPSTEDERKALTRSTSNRGKSGMRGRFMDGSRRLR